MKNRVRELRNKLGLTQSQLGELLKVSRQTINAIENDRYDPSLPLAFSISEVLGAPIEKIFQNN